MAVAHGHLQAEYAQRRPFDAATAAQRTTESISELTDCLPVALARGSREPGQAITGAALSGVLLCEGRSKAVVVLCSELDVARRSIAPSPGAADHVT